MGRVLLFQCGHGTAGCSTVNQETGSAEVGDECRSLCSEVIVRSANEFVPSTCRSFTRCVLKELEVLTIIVAEHGQLRSSAHETGRVHRYWIIILGQKRKGLVRVTPDQQVQRVIRIAQKEKALEHDNVENLHGRAEESNLCEFRISPLLDVHCFECKVENNIDAQYASKRLTIWSRADDQSIAAFGGQTSQRGHWSMVDGFLVGQG